MRFEGLKTFTGKHKVPKDLIVSCKQIHSANIQVVSETDRGNTIADCDGLITNSKNVCLIISTADCVPISLYDPVKKAIAVVHAGWRGTQKEIIKKAISVMQKKFGTNPKDLNIYIGPAIDKDNYLVRSDVFDVFQKDYSQYFTLISDDQWKFDLVGVNIQQALDSGVPQKNIELSNISTFKDKNYPSFRRDGKTAGFITGIMLK